VTGTAGPAADTARTGVGAGTDIGVATEIARRCTDPAVLAQAVAATARQSRYAALLPWRPASLAQGHAGIAVLCAELDRREPGAGWDRAGHRNLQAAVAAASPYDASLFSGLAGIGFAALHLSAGRSRYGRLLAQVDAALAGPVRLAVARLSSARGCAAHDLDLISGLTGLGVYLLTRVQAAAHAAEPSGSARDSLDVALAALARLLAADDNPRPWHTPGHLAAGTLRDAHPGGHHNCGLAHGVPGPLALLSLAVAAGLPVPRGREALESTAEWLAANRTGTPAQPDWPDAVPLDAPPRRPADADRRLPGRAAWCYGAPGVARSLWLAGVAAGEPRWQRLAARTVRAIAARPSDGWLLCTPTFCHGTAGLLQVLHRFAADLPDPAVAATARSTSAHLAARFDPACLLGVRGVEPEGTLVDHPGLLDGAPGIALALLGPPPDGPPPNGSPVTRPAWDRTFLLS
jgi:hypothetical protein